MELKDRIGKAYRFPDGLVRWVTHLSRRGNYRVLWYDEPTLTWHYGGLVRVEDWPEGIEEVRAPQPGETFQLAGGLGVPQMRVVPAGMA